ncbi:hypothetical protein RQP53_24170 [Paucibacter sp. APW11]|uniref:Glycine zipper family protein n=1 Tax=Roseateles aquae TaxID=3077235 RepID=A0ABU3PIW9_9BURK|nr:hypothetical protein [Paucibacter sp. APW11]MDT9002399.1 hypothetical protein [Paucibacter sp. APW11]
MSMLNQKSLTRALIISGLVLAQGVAMAGPHGGHGRWEPPRHHHHHHGGVGVGGLLLGLAVAVPLIALASQAERDRQPDVVYQPVYQPVPAPPPPVQWRSYEPVPAPVPSRADPIIYPRNGQGAWQTEADRQECNRWATTQQAAMQDSSVFNRAVAACMDGRGYTMR